MNTAKTLITMALQTEIKPGRRVWNLHTVDGHLVGWTPELPVPETTQPIAFQYGTGDHVNVAYAANVQIAPLP